MATIKSPMNSRESLLIKEIINNVNLIVISQHGSSGSNLLHSLLDSHSEIYIMPIHLKYPIWSEIYADDRENYWDGTTALSKCVREFLNSYPVFTDKKKSCSSIVDVCGKVNPWAVLTKFWTLFDHLYHGSNVRILQRRVFIILMHVAFDWVMNGSLEKKEYCVISMVMN